MAALQLGSAAVDLSLTLDHLPVADASDAQPAQVFGICYSGHINVISVRLVAAKIDAFQGGPACSG